MVQTREHAILHFMEPRMIAITKMGLTIGPGGPCKKIGIYRIVHRKRTTVATSPSGEARTNGCAAYRLKIKDHIAERRSNSLFIESQGDQEEESSRAIRD